MGVVVVMLSLLLGETGGVTPTGLVDTVIGAPGPGRANFSGREKAVLGSRGRGGSDRGAGEGRNAPWGRAEWNLDNAAGGVNESLIAMGIGPPPSPPDSLRSP